MYKDTDMATRERRDEGGSAEGQTRGRQRRGEEMTGSLVRSAKPPPQPAARGALSSARVGLWGWKPRGCYLYG